MSAEDETSHLLRNPGGARRAVAALERARRGEFEERELSEPQITTEAQRTRE
ncbi:hypothetical protein [Clavibacter zhangzhiyongii]|uniref:hypothetical protein n=1 Tax=Clavibacter zhangzhiyongii TaxID=2768071 RepID=UPI00195DAA10|nr:hypothetical protein [Clavibacter zhangzhiyongii]MBM7025153.1 hypothetical protein [Clavibacter zhangzhiyongii]